MTNTNKLLRVLLGASALTAFTAGSAFAQSITLTDNNFTAADTDVSNTFTLNYSVDSVPQPEINNENGTINDPDGPTVFTVDRLIDLTVVSVEDQTVAPGATEETILFAVANDGNDTHGFLLDLLEETADSTTTSTVPTSGTETITYYIDDGDGDFEPNGTGDGAAAIDYDPANPPELDPDQVLWVIVTRDIAASAVDGDDVEISLISTASDAVGTPLVNDTTNDPDLDAPAENVFGDAQGDASTGDAVTDGKHSDTGQYLVASADIEAEKSVALHSVDGSTCATLPGGTVVPGHFIPGACVEYVITVTNDGSEDATAITIDDTLDTNLTFVAAAASGFSSGSLSTVPAANSDCGVTACLIELTAATLDGAAAPGTGAPTTGTITIRALIK